MSTAPTRSAPAPAWRPSRGDIDELAETLAPVRPQHVEPALPHRRLALEQLTVLGGQVGSGVGNLLFSLLLARLLAPGSFAQVASFGALYLILGLPATGLTAAGAAEPALHERWRRRTEVGGAAIAVLLGALAVPVAPLVGLTAPQLGLLGVAAPSIGPLALARGRLYGTRTHRGLVASLLAEPTGRLAVGAGLAPLFGATGADAAIVLAGYLSLAVAHRAAPRLLGTWRAGAPSPARGVLGAFLLLAVLQNQDVVIANAVLGRGDAGVFAVVSTLGSIAAFATFTVPLVLLARAHDRGREPLGVALAIAAAAGGLIVCGFAVAPVGIVDVLFGGRYADAGGIAVPYLLAMGLLAVTRVFAARLSVDHCRLAAVLLAGPTLLQVVLLAAVARSPEGVAEVTLGATALTTALTGAAVARELPAVRRLPGRLAAAVRGPAVPALAVVVLVGLGVRLLITRGLWIDEASSVTQAELGFHRMLHNLRATDVHPPLYFSLLWLDIRVLGAGQLAVRLPSIAAGILLTPALYLVGRDLYDRRAGLAAAALGAFAPQMVWYSQEARMYALFMLLAVVAVWAQIRVLRRGGAGDWALYTAASAALAWTEYFALLLIAAQQAVFGLAAWRDGAIRPRVLRAWPVAAAAFCVLVAPLVPFAYHQFQVNQASGRGFGSTPSQAGVIVGETKPSLYAFLANVVWALWGYHADATMVDLVALWPLAMLLALFLLGRGWSRTSSLLVGLALAPALALFAIGQAKRNLFDLRYFIAAVPLLLLLVGRGLTTATRGRAGRVALAGLFSASLLAGLVDQQLNRANPRRYDFAGAVQAIEARARPGDVVVYNPIYLAEVLRYYGPSLHVRDLALGIPRRAQAPRVFLVASFFDHSAIAAATRHGLAHLERRRRLVLRLRFSNVRVWEFR